MDFIHFVDVFSFFLTIAPHQASQRPCGDPYRAWNPAKNEFPELEIQNL